MFNTNTTQYRMAHDRIADLLHDMSDVDIVQIAGEIDMLCSLFDGAFSVYEISDLCDCADTDLVARAIFESGATLFTDTVRNTPYGWEMVTGDDLIYEATQFYFDDVVDWLIDNGSADIDWPISSIGEAIDKASNAFWEAESDRLYASA